MISDDLMKKVYAKAKAGDLRQMVGYARALILKYCFGTGAVSDLSEARHFLLAAAEKGSGEAYYSLSWLFHIASEYRDPDAGFRYLERAADLKHSKAVSELSEYYFYGWYPAKKSPYYALALADSVSDTESKAQVLLGIAFLRGVLVNKDAAKAYEYFLRAGVNEDVDAIAYLGECYLKGEGVERNEKLGIALYKYAAPTDGYGPDKQAMMNLKEYGDTDPITEEQEQLVERFLQEAYDVLYPEDAVDDCDDCDDPDEEYDEEELYNQACWAAAMAAAPEHDPDGEDDYDDYDESREEPMYVPEGIFQDLIFYRYYLYQDQYVVSFLFPWGPWYRFEAGEECVGNDDTFVKGPWKDINPKELSLQKDDEGVPYGCNQISDDLAAAMVKMEKPGRDGIYRLPGLSSAMESNV
ncbi:MAG: sel1 repeat family protein [Lachnospiraceae bacterium]|nr:sel1 repeat family protein [Lachnospiraceae bacterium]